MNTWMEPARKMLGNRGLMDHPDGQTPADCNALKTNLLVAGLFFGGMMAGVLLAAVLAPNSELAMLIGFMVWPISFGISMSLWYSLTSSDLLKRLGRALFKSLWTGDLNGSLKIELKGADLQTMTGSKVVVPTTVLISFFAGLVIACSPTARNFEFVVTAFTGCGLGYGMLVTWLARTGILPMPKAA